MRTALLLALALLVVAGAWVRLAPMDPARWHTDPGEGQDGPNSATLRLPQPLPPAQALAALARVAEATPRTTRLAGTEDGGRITWITRSRLWGFPDATTAAAIPDGDGSILILHARSRYGQSDLGVNRARLAAWAAALRG